MIAAPETHSALISSSPAGGIRKGGSVADGGPGVAPEIRDTLFELLASSKGDGRGIGLAICRSIAFAHGGGIRVADAPGGGAVFTVTLRV